MAKALTEFQTFDKCDVIIWDDGSITFNNGWEDITLSKLDYARLENIYWAWKRLFTQDK